MKILINRKHTLKSNFILLFFQAFIVTPKTIKTDEEDVEYEDTDNSSESIAPVAQRRSLETYKHSIGR